MHWPGLAVFRFSRPGAPIFVAPEPGVDRELIEDTYHRSVLPMVLQAWGLEALHASAVLGPRGVVAFCAAAETGKSTTARALANLGYEQWADDAVAFCDEADGFMAVPLPFRPRLSAEAAQLLNFDAETATRQPCRQQLAPLAAVCLLERAEMAAGPEVAIARLAPGAALGAILANAHSFDPADPTRKRELYKRYLRLVAIVPCFAVSFAPGFERLAQLLERMRREIVDV